MAAASSARSAAAGAAASSSSSAAPSFFSRFMAATSSTLPRQCVSASVLFATGDVIAQQAVERRGGKHDVVRTLRLASYGGVIFAPLMARWFGSVLERVRLGNKYANVAAKVALDQCVASPVMVGVFFSATTLMEGKSTDDVRKKLSESWWPTYKTACALWAPVQSINMAFVPPMQRLLFVNVVSIFWNTFLSAQAAAGKASAVSGAEEVDEEVEASKAPQEESARLV